MGLWDMGAVAAAFSEAAVNPTAWARALNVVAAQAEAFGAILFPVVGHHPPNVPLSDRMEELVSAYFRGARRRDDRNQDAATMKSSRLVNDLDSVSIDEKKKRSSYQELLASAGIRWSAEVKITCGGDLWCLSVQRSLQQIPFSPEEKHKLAQLSQSLSSAAAISRSLGFATTKAALDAFEVSDTAVLLVDRLGHVVRVNASAERLLKGEIRLSNGKMVANDQNAARQVERALHKLLQIREAALTAPIPIPRNSQRPLLVYLIKLPSMASNAFAECQAIAVLIDPDKRWTPSEMTLRASFGFHGRRGEARGQGIEWRRS